jgi:TetR/AcrR family transcriptional repressor of nem operon
MARHNTREQIVEAGMKTLLEKGFNGCGVQDITAAAGVPKGSFYNHFESKEALGAEIVDYYIATSPSRALLRDTSIPGLPRLRQYFEGMGERLRGYGYERGCLIGNFSAEMADKSPVIRDRLANVYVHWTRDVAVAIADAQDSAAIATKTPAAELAVFVMSAYEGAILRCRVEKSGHAFDVFLKLLFSTILV